MQYNSYLSTFYTTSTWGQIVIKNLIKGSHDHICLIILDISPDHMFITATTACARNCRRTTVSSRAKKLKTPGNGRHCKKLQTHDSRHQCKELKTHDSGSR